MQASTSTFIPIGVVNEIEQLGQWEVIENTQATKQIGG